MKKAFKALFARKKTKDESNDSDVQPSHLASKTANRRSHAEIASGSQGPRAGPSMQPLRFPRSLSIKPISRIQDPDDPCEEYLDYDYVGESIVEDNNVSNNNVSNINNSYHKVGTNRGVCHSGEREFRDRHGLCSVHLQQQWQKSSRPHQGSAPSQLMSHPRHFQPNQGSSGVRGERKTPCLASDHCCHREFPVEYNNERCGCNACDQAQYGPCTCEFCEDNLSDNDEDDGMSGLGGIERREADEDEDPFGNGFEDEHSQLSSNSRCLPLRPLAQQRQSLTNDQRLESSSLSSKTHVASIPFSHHAQTQEPIKKPHSSNIPVAGSSKRVPANDVYSVSGQSRSCALQEMGCSRDELRVRSSPSPSPSQSHHFTGALESRGRILGNGNPFEHFGSMTATTALPDKALFQPMDKKGKGRHVRDDCQGHNRRQLSEQQSVSLATLSAVPPFQPAKSPHRQKYRQRANTELSKSGSIVLHSSDEGRLISPEKRVENIAMNNNYPRPFSRSFSMATADFGLTGGHSCREHQREQTRVESQSLTSHRHFQYQLHQHWQPSPTLGQGFVRPASLGAYTKLRTACSPYNNTAFESLFSAPHEPRRCGSSLNKNGVLFLEQHSHRTEPWGNVIRQKYSTEGHSLQTQHQNEDRNVGGGDHGHRAMPIPIVRKGRPCRSRHFSPISPLSGRMIPSPSPTNSSFKRNSKASTPGRVARRIIYSSELCQGLPEGRIAREGNYEIVPSPKFNRISISGSLGSGSGSGGTRITGPSAGADLSQSYGHYGRIVRSNEPTLSLPISLSRVSDRMYGSASPNIDRLLESFVTSPTTIVIQPGHGSGSGTATESTITTRATSSINSPSLITLGTIPTECSDNISISPAVPPKVEELEMEEEKKPEAEAVQDEGPGQKESGGGATETLS